MITCGMPKMRTFCLPLRLLMAEYIRFLVERAVYYYPTHAA